MRPVVIIFGAAVRPGGQPSGAMRGRVAAAVETGRHLTNPLYMPTGGQGRFGPPEALVMADMLVRAGIDRAAIEPEPTGRNTIRSVQACAQLLRPTRGPTRARVYVATSAYHMARCVLLLRLNGLRARPGTSPAAPASTRFAKRWFWRLRELPAVPIDAAVMVFWRLTGRS